MARLKIGRSALYDLLRTRRLASLTIGRARRIPTHALDEYVQRHLEEAAR
ncbi:helix-turn-helix domain-containing protein [Streptomyces sp. NPDC096094]